MNLHISERISLCPVFSNYAREFWFPGYAILGLLKEAPGNLLKIPQLGDGSVDKVHALCASMGSWVWISSVCREHMHGGAYLYPQHWEVEREEFGGLAESPRWGWLSGSENDTTLVIARHCSAPIHVNLLLLCYFSAPNHWLSFSIKKGYYPP